jgi:hypothetical protein
VRSTTLLQTPDAVTPETPHPIAPGFVLLRPQPIKIELAMGLQLHATKRRIVSRNQVQNVRHNCGLESGILKINFQPHVILAWVRSESIFFISEHI